MARIYNGRGITHTQTLREAVVTVEPLVEPVSLSEARDWLEIENFTEDDPKLKLIIKSARQWCEKWLSRSLITQTLTSNFENYGRKINLPYSPVQSVTSVTRIQNDVSTLLTEGSDYYVMANRDKYLNMNTISYTNGFLYPKDRFHNSDSLEVVYVSGYGDEKEDVPELIREAILRIVSTNYESRNNFITGTTIAKAPNEAKALLKPYKRHIVF